MVKARGWSFGVGRCEELGEGLGVERVFGLLDAGVERFGGVVWETWDGGLAEDGAGIDPCIDEVDGAAGDGISRIEGLFPCLESAIFGEKGGVDIDDAVWESGEEGSFDDTHPTGEHDPLGAG